MRRSRLAIITPAEDRHWRYEARKSLGKCARCGVEPRRPDQATCQPCMDAMAEGKRQAQACGLCEDCWKEPALPGKRWCVTHAEQRKARSQQRYWLRRVQHLCVKCGKKRSYKGMALCKEHLEQDRRRKKSRPSHDQSSGEFGQQSLAPSHDQSSGEFG
jgi:hypothetical protein